MRRGGEELVKKLNERKRGRIGREEKITSRFKRRRRGGWIGRGGSWRCGF